jgi:pSer/pThr/pTyr-binding forkhead associated (FHA) protein/tetratricopeptide (TPR) repeat protein
MARLRIRLHGKITQDVSLSTERAYMAGRREDSDIVLQSEKGISREHFKLTFNGTHWQLDVLSRFGDVLAEGEKVQTLLLDGPKLFFLGPYEFEYSEMSTELVAASSSHSQVEVSDHTYVNTAETVPYVKVVDGSGEAKEMFQLEGGDTWVAGREVSCDIVIRDQRVSRRQFEIRRQGSFYTIMDLGSVNGTLLNGTPISSTEPTPVKSSDAISVLDNHLYFELHDPKFKARMELVNASAPSPLVALPQEVMNVPQYQQYPQNYLPPTMHGNPMGHQASGNEGKGKFDYEKHRVKLIIGAVALLLVAYLFSGNDDKGPKPASQGGATTTMKPSEAFGKLPPEKQTLVKQTYQLSKNLYMQGKYELAKSEIAKIYELVPEYEDSKDIERLANEAIEIQRMKDADEARLKALQAAEEKIQNKTAECKTKMNPDTTMNDLEDCLTSVLALNPEHAAILELRHQVDQLVADKQTKELARQERNGQVQKLKGLYGRAEGSLKENQYLRAIKEYQVVISSSLPDPNFLKSQARRQVASIQQTLKQKTDQYEKEADQAYKDQKLRDAILALRKGMDVDPTNDSTKDKADRYILELKKQMMVLYQEGVLEESYGNVEGGENRPGAKDKWKKIMDLDIPDGEYYIKAKIKLKKYGAL